MPNQSITLTQDQRLSLVLAPQLRQSLEMLQAPILELKTMLRAELDRNPVLEEIPTDISATPESAAEALPEPEKDEHERMDFRKEFDILARLDDEWKDYFFQQTDARPYTSDDAERRQYFFDSIAQNASLQEHLLHQLALSELDTHDRKMGELLIGNINDDGFLTGSLDELSSMAAADPEHIATILQVIQDFDPPGVGARDLKECLTLQLQRLGLADSIAARIVAGHLERIAAKKFTEIARLLKISPEEVHQAANLIGTLNPRPGQAYSSESSPYISPEVSVHKIEGEYVVILNDDQLPHLRISKQYRSLMSEESTTDEVKKYIVEKIRAGVFLMKSIGQRQQTIFKIATEIVRVQRAFFDHGIAHLKPLVMSEVAEAVGLHETTVSRAASGKHMQTPRGVFEIKFFFTPGLKTTDGNILSNLSVKDIISSLIKAEDPAHPLADQDIYEALTAKGINIARRTVAKYRIALRIPPSHLRKSG